MGIEIALVFATAVTGYLQGDLPVVKIFQSVLWGFAGLGIIVFSIFAYQYARYPFLALAAYENENPDDELEIVYRSGIAPFQEDDRGNQLFSVGVALRNGKTSIEDVSVRLEKLEPNPDLVPLLDFRELIFSFAETYAKDLSPVRSVTINPGQTRYFEVVFSYGATFGPELAFFPRNYPLKPGNYLLGLRATGRNCRSEYIEFKLGSTGNRLTFNMVQPLK